MHRGLRAAGALALYLMIGVNSVAAQDTHAGHRKGAPATEAPSGQAQNEKAARDAFERGRSFYDAGAFEQAANAFGEAYRLSGRDQLLYNLYLAQRDANHPAEAAEALRGYLARVPNIDNRSQLESRLAALDAGLARDREAQAQAAAQAQAQADAQAAAAAAAPVAPAPIAPVEPIETKRSNKFWAGIGLISVGGAMMLSSIATGALAHNHQQKLEDDCPGKVCNPDLKSTADSGKTLAHATDGLLFGGLAVAAGGAAVLFLWHGLERVPSSAPPPVTAFCSNTGCMAQTTLRF